MRIPGYVRILAASLAALTLVFAACSDNESSNGNNGGNGENTNENNGENGDNAGGGSTSDDAPFDPERADELAHLMLLEPGDLPGTGWDVVGRDQFDDDEEDNEDFERLVEGIPECEGLSDLARLGEALGETEDDDPPAGRAKVELERPTAALLPANVEMEVEIEEHVADIMGGWTIAKELFESEGMRECFPALMQAATFEESEDTEGLEFQIEARDPAAEAPNDGVAMAFLMKVNASGLIQFDLAADMYIWPYGNAGITLMILRDAEAVDDEGIQAIVDAADRKVRAAAE